MDTIQKLIKKILDSTRVQGVIVAIVLGFFQKYFPQHTPDPAIVLAIIGAIAVLIAGDTVRPVDPSKPTLMGVIAEPDKSSAQAVMVNTEQEQPHTPKGKK